LDPNSNALQFANNLSKWAEYYAQKQVVSEVWMQFLHDLKYKNRFIPDKTVMRFIKKLPKYTEVLPKSSEYFRARIIEVDDFINMKIIKNEDDGLSGIYGLSGDKMGAPPERIATSGRANPMGISYLYLASDEATACIEVRPALYECISVSKFKLNKKLKVINLCKAEIEDTIERLFISNIMVAFATPYRKQNDIEYSATQYISAFVKSKGFDGIKYCSMSNDNNGNVFNLVLFNTAMATPVNDYGTVYRKFKTTTEFQNLSVLNVETSTAVGGTKPMEVHDIIITKESFIKYQREAKQLK